MLYGALIPERLGERIGENGFSTYNAITHVYYFGSEATVTGLDERISKRDVQELITKIYDNDCNTLRYYSKGKLITWRLYRSAGGVVRGKMVWQQEALSLMNLSA